jgi:hypothetical protein
MFDEVELGIEFFEGLVAIDEMIAHEAAKSPCRFCGGRLHRSDYARKPRGGLFGAAGEAFSRRLSLCCGREGCRRRSMPPSVRFLGRRVYLGAVVIVGSVVALAAATAAAIRRATGIAPRTTRRWLRWWRGPFTKTPVHVDFCARAVGPPGRRRLPASLLEVLETHERGDALMGLLVWLLPLTASEGFGSRWARGNLPNAVTKAVAQKMARRPRCGDG